MPRIVTQFNNHLLGPLCYALWITEIMEIGFPALSLCIKGKYKQLIIMKCGGN